MKNKSKLECTLKEKVSLKLYVTGMSENSLRAIQNITLLCDRYLNGRFDLEIIDIYKSPSVAEEQKIIFSPSFIRQFPLPRKIFIGDLSDTEKVVLGLGINLKE